LAYATYRGERQQLTERSWQDVVNVPARSNVKVRIAFEDFTGRTVYHCHILDHEDQGMMGVIDARR
jgi:FtsP/CotA-like multicopper oxidase with cupredoxin domain